MFAARRERAFGGKRYYHSFSTLHQHVAESKVRELRLEGYLTRITYNKIRAGRNARKIVIVYDVWVFFKHPEKQVKKYFG